MNISVSSVYHAKIANITDVIPDENGYTLVSDVEPGAKDVIYSFDPSDLMFSLSFPFDYNTRQFWNELRKSTRRWVDSEQHGRFTAYAPSRQWKRYTETLKRYDAVIRRKVGMV